MTQINENNTKSPSLHHSFDINLAAEHSIEEALLIHHFQHWILVNYNQKSEPKEGLYWTYQTVEWMAAHFTYWSTDQIRRIIKKLVEKGILKKGDFNKKPFDHTTWYALADQSFLKPKTDVAKSPNGTGEIANAIPDTKTNTKEERAKALSKSEPTKQGIEIASLLFQRIKQKNTDAKPPDLTRWGKEVDDMMRIDKRTDETIRKMIDFIFTKDEFWYKNILSPSKLRKHFDAITLRMNPWKKNQPSQTGLSNSSQNSSANALPEQILANQEQNRKILAEYLNG